ncbi:MAG: hypothetical protein CHKLHMKO_00629 [Candidatus Argoarchaeum ethanivorans]|uniref:Uncharacterized protein n=1 Tax=Candidatus Argoarchaeum ethanivorans TaxID=2608793 RepID=A0A811TI10_9EURY|nr:MAG: hypothetical protein CHKLHMKO_00629 [Candidatus Argoarchaeum ethanivorans]
MPSLLHECDSEAEAPEATDEVQLPTVPSPQSNLYWTLSPSGSVAEVEYVYVVPVSPEEEPEGLLGVLGGLFVFVMNNSTFLKSNRAPSFILIVKLTVSFPLTSKVLVNTAP